MVAVPSTMLALGTPAPAFALEDAGSGRRVSPADFGDARALLVMFICNHCPYVKAVRTRLVREARELRELGVGSVAIMSNDPAVQPEDSFENMRLIAREFAFPFPYLLDETQSVARAYGAVCTPDFFGYNSRLELQYRGRLDASRKETAPVDARRELFEAMRLVAETGEGPREQIPGIGCSIKWRETASQG
jgi:peroxiredoxin